MSMLMVIILAGALLTGCSIEDSGQGGQSEESEKIQLKREEITEEDKQDIQEAVDELYDIASTSENVMDVWYAMFPDGIKELRENYFSNYQKNHPDAIANIEKPMEPFEEYI